MKTSLNLDDALYKAALKEARATGKSLSETITRWARLGWKMCRKAERTRARTLPTADLGERQIDIDCRRDWMQELDDRP